MKPTTQLQDASTIIQCHTEIPVIDISPFLFGSAEEKKRVADQWYNAFSGIGFAIVTGHSIAPAVIEEAYSAAKEFFHLPVADKLRCCTGTGYGGAGYQPEGVETVTATVSIDHLPRPPDAVESMLVHKRHTDVIPNYPPNYKHVMYTYWDQMISLLHSLMEITAVALGLPTNFFESCFAEPECVLRLGYYPAKNRFKDGQLRYGEHTDYTGYTILKQDSVSGLQVKLPSGEWIDCPTIEGTFIVNAGDMIQVWTNDVFKSNLHRVVNTAATSDRLSLVFFTGPHPNTLIECLPGCTNDANPKKYLPVNSGQHLKNKLLSSNK